MAKKRKIRVPLRKNRQNPRRQKLRPDQLDDDARLDSATAAARLTGRGTLTRHRTIVTSGDGDLRAVDLAGCQPGRVLSPRGGTCLVQLEGGGLHECAVRQVLKNMELEDRTAVAAGDRVLVRLASGSQGVIERVEQRRGVLSRCVRGQRHVLAANVDQVLVVGSAADPPLKPSLIDRYLISAQAGGIVPIICINKIDLATPGALQPIFGVYGQLGYDVVPTSATTGRGIERLKHLLQGKVTALAGQSGVGKTSLVNCLDPALNLKTVEVSADSRKGKHTTTSARLMPLACGGWVVDTPGIRQLDLWDVIPAEVEGYFVEFHPFVRQCRFPDCSHRHEEGCGVKQAVARGMISMMRYGSYCRIRGQD
jgi:ribosome biogenesis GTPase